jgi:hypothetical protein
MCIADDIAKSHKEPAAREVGTHKVQSEIVHVCRGKKMTSSTGRGQSTASDKSSNDLFSLLTAWNTSSNVKKQGIDVNKVILERMVTAHILQELLLLFTPLQHCKKGTDIIEKFFYISDVKKLTQNHIDLSENDILCPVVGLQETTLLVGKRHISSWQRH